MTHLIQDGEGHVTDDVGIVDDQSVPLLRADDAIASQVCLIKGLQAWQIVMLSHGRVLLARAIYE